jgi:hypothetical protein
MMTCLVPYEATSARCRVHFGIFRKQNSVSDRMKKAKSFRVLIKSRDRHDTVAERIKLRAEISNKK